MKQLFFGLGGILACSLVAASPVFFDDFENGTDRWTGSGRFQADAKADVSENGSNALLLRQGVCETRPFPVAPSSRFLVTFHSFSEAYSSFSVEVEELDKELKPLSLPGANRTSEGLWGAGKQQRKFLLPMALYFDTGKEAAFAVLRFRKNRGDKRVWIDDVRVEAIASRPGVTPDPEIPGPYDRDSLMLPGPDGHLYPNFTRAGLTGPWSLPANVFRVEEFGAAADDGKDDSDAVAAAIEAAGKAGGVVLFGPGTYRVTRKISVLRDRVVLRGTDRAASRIEFGIPDSRIGIFSTASDDRLSPRSTVKVFFPNEKVRQVRVSLSGREPAVYAPEAFEKLPDAAGFAAVSFPVAPHFDALGGEGRQLVAAEVEYNDGRIETAAVPFTLDRHAQNDVYASSYLTIGGRNLPPGDRRMLTAGVRRGDRVLELDNAAGIGAGDVILLYLPVTPRWTLVPGAECPWWKWIQFGVRVRKAEGNRLELEQPVRMDFPLSDQPFVSRTDMIRGSGVENLTLSQVGEIQIELKMRAVSFTNAFNCRAAGLTVDRPGTSGVYGSGVKNCEFSDCRFTEPWRTKLGGLAYVGWDRAWDSLISNLESDRMRHAPLFNWSCSGNVVTGSTFNESDAQFHCGWAHDNLIDDSRIVTTTNRYNSYGWALYSVPTDDTMHGYIGPRNVMYHCRTESFNGGVYLGGPNQDWMLMYNSFQSAKGPGVFTRFGVKNTRIAGNVFVLGDREAPMVYFESLDASGDRLTGNRLYGGNGRFTGGPGAETAELLDNQAFPLSEPPSVPAAPAPSLYRWQLEHYPNR